MANAIEIVIGSWGSYNACNERSLGSKWLTLNEYEDWEEIEEELKSEGFDLDGIDEELFIQDISGFVTGHQDWDYVNPQALFEILQEAGILADEYLFEVITGTKLIDRYLESKGWVKFPQPKKEDGKKYTAKEFCLRIPVNKRIMTNRIIANIGAHHIVAIVNGKVLDTWDCTHGCVGNWWLG